ncbi:hypothetical protein DPMN_030641 [Dreissena polymorpha]|uniref:Uncharacterized protein n=1 Tax=Dreissena polymorpha TaxID=45954 RepID=A0A9D4RIA1_DREPO|nr:hypothetical protein DPMN_030641 [Dreissena polymorpha]
MQREKGRLSDWRRGFLHFFVSRRGLPAGYRFRFQDLPRSSLYSIQTIHHHVRATIRHFTRTSLRRQPETSRVSSPE